MGEIGPGRDGTGRMLGEGKKVCTNPVRKNIPKTFPPPAPAPK